MDPKNLGINVGLEIEVDQKVLGPSWSKSG